MSGCWVFGYGSLVSPASFGATVGRNVMVGVDFFAADVVGYGRRWNYGVMHTAGFWRDAAGVERERTIVALGVVAEPGEAVNGVVGWVDDDELVALDRRERHYDRVDVADSCTIHGAVDVRGSIVVYVPNPDAIGHYESARDRGEAAIELRYWELVDRAFAALGPDQQRRYHDTTPAPDVPVLTLRREATPSPPSG